MAIAHNWRECRPALIATPENAEHAKKVNTAMHLAWEQLSDTDKAMFHQFTCHNRHSDQHLAVIARFRDLITAEVESSER